MYFWFSHPRDTFEAIDNILQRQKGKSNKKNKMKGYSDTAPRIKSLHFKNGSIELFLADGRIISAPLTSFPEIKKLTASQRKKYHIMGGVGFDFDDSDEVYHISDFLGADNSLSALQRKITPYHYSNVLSRVAEPKAPYGKKK